MARTLHIEASMGLKLSLTIIVIVLAAMTANGGQQGLAEFTGHGIDAKLLKAVLTVESNLNENSLNAHSLDFGIGQINYRTAKAFGIDVNRLLVDRSYSIRKAAIVLKDFQTRYESRSGSRWPCHYNQGHVVSNERLCSNYLTKIRKAYVGH